MEQREIVLIGLGEFGKTVLKTLGGILQDRKPQLPEDVRDKVILHFMEFGGKGPFSFKELADKILAKLQDSQARSLNEAFSYILIGDLAEEGTALYALDYGFLPWVLDQSRILKRRDVLGFFTFSDELGINERHSDAGMGLIRRFFTSLTDIVQKKVYEPAYQDANGKPFPPVSAPYGPFLRNYVLVTPGNKKAVANETSRVFAERIFYETYYLSEEHEGLASFIQAKKADNPENLFSGFSLVQVSRLRQFQEYYLKFNLQIQVFQHLLAEKIQGDDLDLFGERFFQMMELDPKEEAFPLDRASELFFHNHVSSFKRILDFHVGTENGAYRKYVVEALERLEQAVDRLRQNYTPFIKEELVALLKAMDQSVMGLFKVDRLTGNLNTYIHYLELLEKRFDCWTQELEEVAQKGEIDSIEAEVVEVEKKIAKVLKNKVMNFPLFQPVRQVIIKNHIRSLPFERFIYSLIKKKLAESFLLQWRDGASGQWIPAQSCQKIRSNLESLRNRLEDRRNHVEEKKKFVENVNSFYYVISPIKKNEEYQLLLDRIYKRNFEAPGKKSDLERSSVNAFKTWTLDKDLIGIIGDPTGFVNHIELYALNTWQQFGEMEVDPEKAEQFAQKAVGEMKARMESLSQKSFRLASAGDYIDQKRFYLSPDLTGFDALEDNIKRETNLSVRTVPQDFTMGSSVFFQDYLYLKYPNFQKFEMLEKYQGNQTPASSYSGASASAPVDEAQMTLMAKHVRSVLLDYCTKQTCQILYKSVFGQEPQPSMDEVRVNQLASAVNLDQALDLLDDNALKSYARDKDIPVNPSREKMIRLIVKRISEKAV